MVSTSAGWGPPRVGSKTCRSREIAKANSIARSLTATAAMNRRWRKRLTEMFVAGVSTRHPWEKSLKRCWEWLEVGSTISRLNQSLAQQFETWRQRPLQEHWRILYLDGVHFSIRHGEKADSTLILTALGVDLAGNKEVLARRPCAEEDKDGWTWRLARSAFPRSNPHRSDRDGWA
jgi:transposase-like protein